MKKYHVRHLGVFILFSAFAACTSSGALGTSASIDEPLTGETTEVPAESNATIAGNPSGTKAERNLKWSVADDFSVSYCSGTLDTISVVARAGDGEVLGQAKISEKILAYDASLDAGFALIGADGEECATLLHPLDSSLVGLTVALPASAEDVDLGVLTSFSSGHVMIGADLSETQVAINDTNLNGAPDWLEDLVDEHADECHAVGAFPFNEFADFPVGREINGKATTHMVLKFSSPIDYLHRPKIILENVTKGVVVDAEQASLVENLVIEWEDNTLTIDATLIADQGYRLVIPAEALLCASKRMEKNLSISFTTE